MNKEVLRLSVYDYELFTDIIVKDEFEKVFQSKSFVDYELVRFFLSHNCIELVFHSKIERKKNE